MISILDAEDLLTRAKIFLSSLSRFTEEGPVASILKSSLKGTYILTLSNNRYSRNCGGGPQAYAIQTWNDSIPRSF